MGMWTEWRRLAKGRVYCDEDADNGPGCYELGFGSKSGGAMSPKYAGETDDLKRRLTEHGSDRSQLTEKMGKYLRNRYILSCRWQKTQSKMEAKRMQDNLLQSYEYEWNIQGNP